MSSYPFVQTSSVFNTNDYNVLDTGLTIETANMLYLSLSGGVVSGNLNVLSNLNCTTLTVGGLSLNVGAITGVTPGICSASKALIVDSSRNINNINSLTSTTLILGSTSISETEIGFLDGVSTAGTIYASKVITVNSSSQINSNLQLATSRKILMNNSASSLAYIDMGNTASDRCISLFSDALSYYGFGAGGSQLRCFTKTDFGWYSGATQSVIGSQIMSLTSAGLLTTTSLALSGTITGITGLTLTGAISGVTTLGLSGVLTSSNATASTLNSNGALVLSGGIGISNTTDATSSTNGGTFTTAGGAAIAKALYVGTITNTTGLNVSGVSTISTTQITTTANYSGIMDTASIVLKQASTTNGNKVGIDFMISTNTIDTVNTATCSIVHERILAYVGDLVFNTKRTGTSNASLTEALRISSTGTCSIANTSSGFQLNLGGSGTGINTNVLTTTSLTLGATAITATGIELNYLDLTTGAGTAEASKALVLNSSSNITGINSLTSTTLITTNLTLGATAITATGTELNYLDLTTGTGTAEASKALVLDSSSNITGINSLTTTTLITTNLTLGATAITATGIELNYLDLTTGAGTAEALKALVLDVNKDISSIRNIGLSGIITTSATNTVMNIVAPSSATRANFVFTNDLGVQYEYGIRGSASNPSGLYWYRGSYTMVMFGNSMMSMGNQTTQPTRQLEINNSTGACLRLTYNLTSNLCDFTLSSGGILNITPSSGTTNLSSSTSSTSSTTGAITLAGGIGISKTTDSSSITNGGTFTTAGGIAVAKSAWFGGTIYVNKSTSSTLFSGYSGSANFTVNGLLDTSITIGTGSNNDLNIITGSITAMTIDGINQSIYGIGSLSATNLSATNLYGLIGTPAQTSITSLGTLTALTVSGLTTTGTLNLGGTLITASGTELNYLDITTTGVAQASKALVLNSSSNITGINSITSSYLTISTAINSSAAIASLLKVDLNNISTAYGLFSAKASSSYLSPYFGSSNSMFWAENANASVIEFELNVSNGAMSTSTNPVRMGTCTANDFSLFTAATERLLIRSGGAVAIKNYLQVGDSTDTTRMLSILDNTMTAGTSRYLTLGKSNNTGNQAEITFLYVADNDDTNALTMGFHGGEKVRLTRWGSLLVNSTQNVYSGTKTKFAAEAAGATEWCAVFKNTSAANNKCMGFINNSASEVGSITWGTGTTSFNTTSDYRLKKNIKPLTNCLELLNKLNPVRYNWISDYNEPGEGFIAHELQEVLPLCVVGKKDAVYEDGSINPQSIDYGKLTPHLVAAVKELSKKIEDLESKVKNILSYEDLNKHIKQILKLES